MVRDRLITTSQVVASATPKQRSASAEQLSAQAQLEILYIYPVRIVLPGDFVSQLPPNSLFSLANALAPEKPQGLGLSTLFGPPTASLGIGLTGLAAAAAPAETALKWLYVTKRFKTFLDNLELTALQDADG